MNLNVIEELFEVIQERKLQPTEGAYTSYLFEKGLDKILKKVGEEASEVIIASKNENKDEVILEVCDLIYHLLVLLSEKEIKLEDVIAELEKRRLKVGNKKPTRTEEVKL